LTGLSASEVLPEEGEGGARMRVEVGLVVDNEAEAVGSEESTTSLEHINTR
jgi:hypothetical protein